MDRLFYGYCKLLEGVIATLLAIMVILVFGNVVLRYAFNSGITISEEISRWLFVWLTFIGAVVAFREKSHLGTEFLTARLSPLAQKACHVLASLAMLFTCALLFQGALEQTRINWDVSAPTSGASVGIFYASGMVFSVSVGLMLISDLIKLFTADDSSRAPSNAQAEKKT